MKKTWRGIDKLKTSKVFNKDRCRFSTSIDYKQIPKSEEDFDNCLDIKRSISPSKLYVFWRYKGGGLLNYTFIRRFLSANVGRHWNEVFRDLVSYCDKGSAVRHDLIERFVGAYLKSKVPCKVINNELVDIYGYAVDAYYTRHVYYLDEEFKLRKFKRKFKHDYGSYPGAGRHIEYQNYIQLQKPKTAKFDENKYLKRLYGMWFMVYTIDITNLLDETGGLPKGYKAQLLTEFLNTHNEVMFSTKKLPPFALISALKVAYLGEYKFGYYRRPATPNEIKQHESRLKTDSTYLEYDV